MGFVVLSAKPDKKIYNFSFSQNGQKNEKIYNFLQFLFENLGSASRDLSIMIYTTCLYFGVLPSLIDLITINF